MAREELLRALVHDSHSHFTIPLLGIVLAFVPACNATARLVIVTNPPGATVTVNGEEFGQTPVKAFIRATTFGDYRATIVKEGYVSQEVELSKRLDMPRAFWCFIIPPLLFWNACGPADSTLTLKADLVTPVNVEVQRAKQSRDTKNLRAAWSHAQEAVTLASEANVPELNAPTKELSASIRAQLVEALKLELEGQQFVETADTILLLRSLLSGESLEEAKRKERRLLEGTMAQVGTWVAEDDVETARGALSSLLPLFPDDQVLIQAGLARVTAASVSRAASLVSSYRSEKAKNPQPPERVLLMLRRATVLDPSHSEARTLLDSEIQRLTSHNAMLDKQFVADDAAHPEYEVVGQVESRDASGIRLWGTARPFNGNFSGMGVVMSESFLRVTTPQESAFQGPHYMATHRFLRRDASGTWVYGDPPAWEFLAKQYVENVRLLKLLRAK